MIVADCSALVHVLTADHLDHRLVERLESSPIHAPHLLDIEVLHALRGLLLGRKVTDDRVAHARALYDQLAITRYPLGAMSDRVWQLRNNMTGYDATYAALAEALSVPLVTLDRKFLGAGHGAEVEVYGGH